jgi:hypothetical protein
LQFGRDNWIIRKYRFRLSGMKFFTAEATADSKLVPLAAVVANNSALKGNGETGTRNTSAS